MARPSRKLDTSFVGAWRKLWDLTQDQAAGLIQQEPTTYLKWEREENGPSKKKILEILALPSSGKQEKALLDFQDRLRAASARAGPPPPRGPDKQKRPGNPEGITEPLQVEDSSDPGPPPSAELSRQVAYDAVEALLLDLSDLREQGRDLLRWTGAERLTETMDLELAPTPPAQVKKLTDLDQWAIADCLEYVDTLPALRHMTTAMQDAYEFLKERRQWELRGFLVWLLERAGQLLRDANAGLGKTEAWLDGATQCSARVDGLRGWLQREPLVYWALSHSLREGQEDLSEVKDQVGARFMLLRQLREQVEALFMAWNKVYEELPRQLDFEFKGFLGVWDPFEVALVISSPGELAQWKARLAPSLEDSADWETETP